MAPNPLLEPVMTTMLLLIGGAPFGVHGGQIMPPLAYTVCPFTQRAGPARKDTTSAMSSGVPRRSSGGAEARLSISCWLLPSRNSGVAVGPGATALTVMSRPRSSRARIAVRVSTAALLAAYPAYDGKRSSVTELEKLMIAPPLRT